MTISHSTLDEGYDFFITDKWNNPYDFKISSFHVPSGLFSEAYEVIDHTIDDEPRIFHSLSNFDSDMEKAELQLMEKIKKGINKRYLDYTDGNYSICQDLEIAGRILMEDNPDNSEFDNFFQIEGKKNYLRKIH